MNLLETVKKAEKTKVAVGHFNISNLEMLKAVSYVAAKLNLPVIIGVSEGERGYIGVHHARDLIASYNKEHSFNIGTSDVPNIDVNVRTSDVQKLGGYRLFLNADHTYSLDKVKEAAELGYDSIVFDGSKLLFEENIKRTREAVLAAKAINKNIVVEGELGYIGKSSKVLEELPEGAKIKLEDLPTAEEAKRFVEETGIDMLAPAVGNIHGMFKDVANPNLQIGRIREIKGVVKIPLVLHGGSGISDKDFLSAIHAGISVIHISTELRIAWRKALEEALKSNPEEIAPYKIMPAVLEEMEETIEKKLRLFSRL